MTKGEYIYTRLEFHSWETSGRYTVRNELYRKRGSEYHSREALGKRVLLTEAYPNLQEVTLVENSPRPLFSYMRPSIANNLLDNTPLGISVYANALGTLKALDICYDSFIREFVLGRKRIIVPVSAIRTVINPLTGNPVRYFDANDDVFLAMNGEEDGTLDIKDNTVEIRVEEHEAAINAFLGILSFQLGLSPGSLTFDRAEGLKTATEVISEKSKTFKTIKLHQVPIRDAIIGTAHSIIATAILYGVQYKGQSVEELAAPGYEVNVFFDDSIVQDRQTNLNEGIQLVTNSLMSKKKFMIDKLGYTEEEAEAELKAIAAEAPVADSTAGGFFGGFGG